MTKPNTTPPVLTEQDIKRFWSKVSKEPGQGPKGECWEWQAGRNKQGYGAFSVKLRSLRAHRVAYFLEYGVWPPDNACHHCDNPPCCRPEHFFEGTTLDNNRDKEQKGRGLKGKSKPGNYATGESHGSHTHPENRARGKRQGAYTHPETVRRGGDHWNASLTPETVLAIVADAQRGMTHRLIAEKRGASRGQVSGILCGASWSHLTGIPRPSSRERP